MYPSARLCHSQLTRVREDLPKIPGTFGKRRLARFRLQVEDQPGASGHSFLRDQAQKLLEEPKQAAGATCQCDAAARFILYWATRRSCTASKNPFRDKSLEQT
jgi:hypothetical protein